MENTEPVTEDDRDWLAGIINAGEPKVQVTIRLEKWQIARARELAEKTGKGYQTILRRMLVGDLVDSKADYCKRCERQTIHKHVPFVRATADTARDIREKLRPGLKERKYWVCTECRVGAERTAA